MLFGLIFNIYYQFSCSVFRAIERAQLFLKFALIEYKGAYFIAHDYI